MAQAELTPRQQEIKGLLTAGNNAKQIAKKLKITENAVYQQIRRIRANGGTASTGSSRSKANANGGGRKRGGSKAGRQSARKRGGQARTTPAPRPAPPATAEELLRSEIVAATESRGEKVALIESLKGQIAEAEAGIAAHDAEIATKNDVLAVLTGEKVAHAKPAPPKPKRKRSSGSSASKGGGQQSSAPSAPEGESGAQASSQAPSNGSAAETPQPSSQAEREATADHDGGAPEAAASEAPAAA